MLWILAAVPSAAIVVVSQCGKSRATTHVDKKGGSSKSTRSKKGNKSGKSVKGATGKSSKSARKSGSKSGKSAKSGKKSGKSNKSKKGSKKSSKSAKKGVKSKSTSAESLSKSEKKNKSAKGGVLPCGKPSPNSEKSEKSGGKSGRSSKKLGASAKADKKAGELACNTTQCAAPVSAKPTVPLVKPIDLRVEPTELVYKPIGGMNGVHVINGSQERRAFKVKCSDNMLYRVNPVYGIVEPGKSARIDVLRQNGGAKIDKVVVITAKAEDADRDGREVFNRCADGQKEMMVLPLLVNE